MAVRTIRSRDLVVTRWKNGGGTTTEVAIGPPGADLDTFDWRVSMADVATAGPFSTFAGVERTLVLIEGESLVVEVDGVSHRLEGGTPTLAFPGAAKTSARLPSGPIRDLNIMTRQARFRHQVSRSIDSPVTPGTVLILVAIEDATSITIEGQTSRLERFDVLIANSWPPAVAASKPVIWINLTRLTS